MANGTSKGIVLIGMPCAGKSTIGVLLAKAMDMEFVDTDHSIERILGSDLQTYVNNSGYQALRAAEEKVLLKESTYGKVIATGGSAVYSEVGMAHLKAQATVIFLDLPKQQIEQRMTNFTTRGIARRPNQSLSSLFDERRTLYVRYADLQVDCGDKTIDQLLAELVTLSSEYLSR
tara:strand:- start:252 stop:776 length:525 start_codon:yes stop_codon:yes gene_type:complete